MPAPSRDLVSGRRALLTAVQALSAHAKALIVVGAHAVHEWAAPVDEEIGEQQASKDGDLQIDVTLLGTSPELEAAMQSKGFRREEVGIYRSASGVQVDLLVAEAQAVGEGRRSARISGHQPKAARRVRGLEGCLVLNEPRRLAPLGGESTPAVVLRVARPGALLVSKAHKLHERLGTRRALETAKDALDVLRLLLALPTEALGREFTALMRDVRATEVTEQACEDLRADFGTPRAPGSMLLRTGYASRGDEYAARVTALLADLWRAVGESGFEGA